MKWNHTVYERSSNDRVEDLRLFLEDMSHNGWELVIVRAGPKGTGVLRYFFKRPWTVTDVEPVLNCEP